MPSPPMKLTCLPSKYKYIFLFSVFAKAVFINCIILEYMLSVPPPYWKSELKSIIILFPFCFIFNNFVVFGISLYAPVDFSTILGPFSNSFIAYSSLFWPIGISLCTFLYIPLSFESSAKKYIETVSLSFVTSFFVGTSVGFLTISSFFLSSFLIDGSSIFGITWRSYEP